MGPDRINYYMRNTLPDLAFFDAGNNWLSVEIKKSKYISCWPDCNLYVFSCNYIK